MIYKKYIKNKKKIFNMSSLIQIFKQNIANANDPITIKEAIDYFIEDYSEILENIIIDKFTAATKKGISQILFTHDSIYNDISTSKYFESVNLTDEIIYRTIDELFIELFCVEESPIFGLKYEIISKNISLKFIVKIYLPL